MKVPALCSFLSGNRWRTLPPADPGHAPKPPQGVSHSHCSRSSGLERVRRFRQRLGEGIGGIPQTGLLPPVCQNQAKLDPTEILKMVRNRISTSSSPLFTSETGFPLKSEEDLTADEQADESALEKVAKWSKVENSSTVPPGRSPFSWHPIGCLAVT